MGHETDIYKIKIDNISKEIFSLSEDPRLEIQKNDLDIINEFKKSYNQLETLFSSSNIDIESLFQQIASAASLANELGSGLDMRYKYGTRLKTFGTRLMQESSSLIDSLRAHGIAITTNRANVKVDIDFYEKRISEGELEFDRLKQKTADYFRDTKIEISNIAQIAESLRNEIHTLQEDMLAESKKASEISDAATELAKEAQTNIDKLLETTSSKVLLLEYSTTADEEEASADNMRWLSLICMALTAAILLFTLYDTLNSELNWKQSIFRMFIAIALSVPAAYLARESAKHRSQQHTSRRIALDLKAVTPYISSLPDVDQIKIKSEVASRIFGMHNNEAPSDSYPLNIQELVKALIEKIPTNKD